MRSNNSKPVSKIKAALKKVAEIIVAPVKRKRKISIRAIWDALLLPLLFILLFIFALFLQVYGSEYYSSLGSNLVAEFVGALVTVYLIDFLIKRREIRKLLPVKASVYEDVRLMTHWALGLWKEAYVNSVGDAEPKCLADLFSSKSINKILNALDITKPAKTFPVMP